MLTPALRLVLDLIFGSRLNSGLSENMNLLVLLLLLLESIDVLGGKTDSLTHLALDFLIRLHPKYHKHDVKA